jgi:LmbE family N-acetylglucosaminyl deacetylase
MRTGRRRLSGSCLILLFAASAWAQLEPIPEETGATGLALQLRRLGSGAIFLHTAAHPDDEDNGLLVLMSRGRGIPTSLLTATRGDGGQNEIGPELFEAIGILRTEELMAVHRVDGVAQYFTRAYEFGYSFSVEETLEKWGKEEILGDIVRILRTVRPDVVVSLSPEGEGGGQHHQASAILTREAFRAAADPARFPEQIADGLRPWQALKLYSRLRSQEKVKGVRVDTGVYDPILGRTYYEMGSEARSNHKCQGMAQLRALPGSHDSLWKLEDAVLEAAPIAAEEGDLFDGIPTGLSRLEAFTASDFVKEGLQSLSRDVEAATAAFDAREPWNTLEPLRRGLVRLRQLRSRIAASDLPDSEKYELEHRLAPRERDFEKAIALAHGLAFVATAARGEATRGARFLSTLSVTNPSPVPIEILALEPQSPAGWRTAPSGDDQRPFPALPAAIQGGATLEARYEVEVSTDASYDRPYWTRGDPRIDRFTLLEPALFGLPWRPPALVSALRFRSGGVEVSVEKTVQSRYEGKWVGGEKQKEFSVLPLVSVTLSPEVVVFPIGADDRTRPISVTAHYRGTERAQGSLSLEAPPGWRVEPEAASLDFERENQAATVRFRLTPPPSVGTGSYTVKAAARFDGKEFREGVQTIEYHHIQTRYLFRPAEARVEALDLQVAPVKVGFIEGVGDEVPAAIRQLGAELGFLDAEDLAEGDLSRFDVIVTGVRAYLNRQDLRAYNQRLLDYVFQGGTLLVQYNKLEFNDAQWGPYPKKVTTNRVTVEEAPLRILVPEHPVFHSPNRIEDRDWDGWVQERGLYFLAEEGDPRYRDLLASEDPWPYNKGEKKGMLVEAQYGKGRWIYLGLGFFRQLPEGVPSAYKLFANLLSLPKAAAVQGQ